MRKIFIALFLLLRINAHTALSDKEVIFQDVKIIAKAAGQLMLDMRAAGQLTSQKIKLQNGQKIYQTNANTTSSQLILEQLADKYPAYGFLSHDQLDRDSSWHLKHRVWIVQAIDGTRKFAKGNHDFHIQIGLIEGQQPVLGLSYYPAKNTYVWAIENQGAWLEKGDIRQRLAIKPCPEKILIKSSSHASIQPLLQRLNWNSDLVLDECLSSTSRLLKMIKGKASLYISLGAKGRKKKGSICNYAANAIIAKEIGLTLITLSGRTLNFREPSALLTDGILLTSDLNIFLPTIF